MILLDASQVFLSNAVVNITANRGLETQLLRHQILNTIRFLKTKFRDYGELILALDDKDYWRRDYFPYYKAHRAGIREKSELDWKSIFSFLDQIKMELKEFFPYRVLEITGAEADDIIAVLTNMNGSDEENFGGLQLGEKVLIVSGDHDFMQLQKHGNVSQWNPIHKKIVKCSNPVSFLKEHIMKGDPGDGIPNFLSPDNCFVNKIRQTPLSSRKLNIWINQDKKEFLTPLTEKYWERNETLINFDSIPKNIGDSIRTEYSRQDNEKNKRAGILNYFIKNNLRNLIENINDF